MTQENGASRQTFSSRVFGDFFSGSNHAQPKDRALEYVIHRIEHGEHLENVVQESYVRRNCTPAEIDEIVKNPRLVHAARESMEQTFNSGELDPGVNRFGS